MAKRVRLSEAADVYVAGGRTTWGSTYAYRVDRTLAAFIELVGDLCVDRLRAEDIERFLEHFRTEHTDSRGIVRAPVGAAAYNAYACTMRRFVR